jgi:hypothetical protein
MWGIDGRNTRNVDVELMVEQLLELSFMGL